LPAGAQDFFLLIFLFISVVLDGTKVKFFAPTGILENNPIPIIKLATSILNICCFSGLHHCNLISLHLIFSTIFLPQQENLISIWLSVSDQFEFLTFQ
jgi:hypothetical protein